MHPEMQESICKKVQTHLQNEYHVLIAGTKAEGAESEFIVFNVDGMPESTIDEIKKILAE